MSQAQGEGRARGAPLINDPYHANRWDYVYRLESHRGELLENQRLNTVFAQDVLKRIDDATRL